MDRLPPIDVTKLSPDQTALYDQLMNRFGVIAGPFGVWLHSAELLKHALNLQEMFASRVKLERRLLELAVMITARSSTAQFAWAVHEPHALKFGISAEALAANRERRTPDFTREDERLVYDLTMELNQTQKLSAASCRRGIDKLGEQAMVELVGAVGYFTMLALTLNAFDVPCRDGKQPLE